MALVRKAGASASNTERQCLRTSLSGIGLVRHMQCCLTLRSSRPAPAWHLARKALTVIIRLAGQAPYRRGRLSSNVRRHGRNTVPLFPAELSLLSRGAVSK